MSRQPKPKRERTQAQIDSELRREETSTKTLVRHNDESAAALKKLRRMFNESDPEILRIALVELASKKRAR